MPTKAKEKDMFDQLGEDRTDLGEESIGEDFGEGMDDDIQFVTKD